MTTKIGYFTLGPIPTNNELTDITNLGASGAQVCVRNAAAYGLGTNQPGAAGLEDFNYVFAHSGTTYPTDYDDTGVYPLADPAAPPTGLAIPATAKVIYSGVEFLSPAISGSRTDGYTPTIAAHVVTGLAGS